MSPCSADEVAGYSSNRPRKYSIPVLQFGREEKKAPAGKITM
jgi:hypothetical protein